MNPDQKEPLTARAALIAIKDFALRALIIIAAIIVVILGAWGIIKIVPKAVSGVASVAVSISSYFKPAEAVAFKLAPQTVVSGGSTTLAITHTERKEKGTYAISYSCAAGLSIKLSNGADVPCEKNTNVGDVTSVALFPLSTKNRLTEVSVSVSFIPDSTGTVSLKADAFMTVTNDNLPFVDGTGTTVTPVTPAKPVTPATPVVVGKADLVVRVISVGVLNPYNNVFTQKSTVDAGERAAVKFEITNIGGSATGAWRFSALLPDNSAQVYNSGTERSLGAGDSIEFTMGFDNLARSGANTLTISADDTNAVSESNENNNSASVTFYNTGSGSNGGTYPIYPVTPSIGLPDLSVRILDSGSVDPYSGVYTPNGSTVYNYGARAAVRVQVTNIGGSASPSWAYTANLPTTGNGDYSYGSGNGGCYFVNGYQACASGVSTGTAVNGVFNGNQPGLSAGASVILTIAFDTNNNSCQNVQYPYDQYQNCGSYNGTNGSFGFTADPSGYISELRKDNNFASAYVRNY